MKLYDRFTFVRTEKIQMIKLVRSFYNVGLKEAKDIVEELIVDPNLTHKTIEIIVPTYEARYGKQPEQGNGTVDDPYRTYKWFLEICDMNDDDYIDRRTFNGTVDFAEQECKDEAKRYPGRNVYLYRACAKFQTADVIKTPL